MTKFDSVQISHRKGKQASTYTTAELRKNMAIYKATGVHPELEQRAASSAEAAPGLPASDAERPHVFFELVRITATQLRETVGTLVVEVFEDIVPAAGKAFVLRATGGGAGLGGLVRYENTEIHRVVPGVRIDGGQQSVLNGKTGAVPLEQTAASRGLPHAAGAVSLSAQGPTFTVAVAACPHLDGEQQVVGRVTSGMDVLEKLSEAKVDDDFAPFERVYVGTCGVCGPGGPRGEGAALAMETSDVTLMDSDLRKLSWVIHMGKRVIRTIAVNIAFSLIVKGLVGGFMLAGRGSLWAAIASDVGAMLIVTLNGMRLLPSTRKKNGLEITNAEEDGVVDKV